MAPARSSIRIRTLTPADVARWDAFVECRPEGTFFHRAGWKRVLEAAFGHSAHYLYAESETGDILGVLPLGHVRSRLFGNALVSTPFCVYGGSLSESHEIAEQLDAEACRLAESLKVDYLELRYRSARHTDWPSKDLYVTFRKPIDPDPERNLLAIPRKQRAMVRKGIQAGLESRIETDVETVHRLYAESVRNLGTPVFSRTYFRILKEEFGEDCQLLTVHHQGAPIAAVLSFFFRDEVLPYYGGGTLEARALKANDFMYWEVMRRACEQGVRLFDFGRSKRGTGSFDFKRNWGFEPEPMSYEYHLVRSSQVPDVNPLNPKYRLFIEGWKRLPLPLSRLIGPWLSRSLG
ncbi:FemAB family XrtA/PEP-CTERM system-associated protein [Allochromatium vinosum]|uniref:FemAB-related protein, PEP-CTERM system-associated n=1 Tax=Allochromatium vinosum (strain ATCC 17899 / DSM 180 / NBRC 103801 / NCIMB 10441 / D) TaxID=572477 RepID=D3RU52_ALLVD|nr:FemAB family XrtA/PEP-CTERM system-associated protein [Allochromatium vinosum]ADC62711.1 FemAB-related protein, PEP-CTERM system-associated [Allochromatium vinosum DSM 180]MBK1656117.1 peptidoglycan bridge formation protein FemAB [Allochromatium vinosum]